MTPDILRYAAFSDDPSGGNPAGVVLGADQLDDSAMQEIAAQVGYSETAFLHTPQHADGEDRATVRYFSPQAEVDFCGHATIATAVARAERGQTRPLALSTRAGLVRVGVRATDDGAVARLTSVPTSTAPLPDPLLTSLLRALRWDAGDLDPAWPPHVAFGGNHHPVLATRTRQRLADLDYDVPRLRALCLEHGWTTVALVWPESPTRVHARNPFPVGGVVEDPATGAAAAALGGYLRTTRGTTGHLTVLQGEDLGRPSVLGVDIDGDSDRVVVSGTAVRITS